MEQYIPKAAVMAEIEKIEYETNYEPFTDEVLGKRKVCKDLKDFLDTLEVKEGNENPEPAYRSKIIKVKCISPFDETWKKGKVYTGEMWHHGDLNMDFWDIYYDYGSNPKYVQFSSIKMLEKEFAILRNDAFEVKEVDLEEEFDKCCENYTFDDECEVHTARHFFKLGVAVGNKVQKGE